MDLFFSFGNIFYCAICFIGNVDPGMAVSQDLPTAVIHSGVFLADPIGHGGLRIRIYFLSNVLISFSFKARRSYPKKRDDVTRTSLGTEEVCQPCIYIYTVG